MVYGRCYVPDVDLAVVILSVVVNIILVVNILVVGNIILVGVIIFVYEEIVHEHRDTMLA